VKRGWHWESGARGLHWEYGVERGVAIVCKARAHEGRDVIIARFAPQDDGWREIERYLNRGPYPSHPKRAPMAGQPGRRRFRFECDICGQTVVQREETLFPKLDKLRDMLPESGWFPVSLAAL
jgi:hypothetical protein